MDHDTPYLSPYKHGTARDKIWQEAFKEGQNNGKESIIFALRELSLSGIAQRCGVPLIGVYTSHTESKTTAIPWDSFKNVWKALEHHAREIEPSASTALKRYEDWDGIQVRTRHKIVKFIESNFDLYEGAHYLGHNTACIAIIEFINSMEFED